MRKLLGKMRDELCAGEDVILVTVIASSGATPRGAGARMFVTKKGRVYGTIGGGAVEYRSEQIAADALKKKQSLIQAFALTKEDTSNLGMVCGGNVTIYFHYIPGGSAKTIALLDSAEDFFAAGEDVWLITRVTDGGDLAVCSCNSGFIGMDCPEELKASLVSRSRTVNIGENKYYIEKIATSSTVYVFGCGHVGQALVPVLQGVGFRCVALDDRPEFACRELFPTAADVKVIDFKNISASVTINSGDYVVIMTRGHAFDAIVQAQALKTDCLYIGAIGSKQKHANVFKQLREQGFTDDDLARVTAPIGLPISAETPAEIAISIAGQLIEIRAKENKGH